MVGCADLMNGFTTIRDLGTEGAGFTDVDIKKAIKLHNPGAGIAYHDSIMNNFKRYKNELNNIF